MGTENPMVGMAASCQMKANRLATGAIGDYRTDQGVSFSVPADEQKDQYKDPGEE